MSDCCNSGMAGFPTGSQMDAMSMNWPVVWAEISAIQQAILSAANNCTTQLDCSGSSAGTGGSLNVCVGGNTPMTFIDGISSVIVTTHGLGYYTDVPAVTFIPPYNVTITDAATATLTTNGSKVLSISMTHGGAGYESTNATADVTSGTGSGVDLTVVVSASGRIFSITINNGGSGYLVSDTVTAHRAIAPSMTYIDANLVIGSVDNTGKILSINVIDPGTGYQPSNTQVKITSTLSPGTPFPTGAGFQGNPVIDDSGSILGVGIFNGGAGYTAMPPVLVISDPGTGAETKVNLSGNLIVSPGNSVTTIDVIKPGNNYTQDATASVVNPPTAPDPTTDAVVQLVIPTNPFCTNPDLYYKVWQGVVTNRSIQAQLDYVITYFMQAGYTINISTNPASGSSILWCICW